MNLVAYSGNVSGKIEFAKTGGGTPVCTFHVASDRRTKDTVITCWAKINAYGHGLVEACRQKLVKGIYVVVEGELMNREGRLGELLEIRARRVDFPSES
jgi:single-stranded DNA-binding protein